MYLHNKIYYKMLNWIANKLTQGFNFVGEKLSQGPSSFFLHVQPNFSF